MLKFIIAKSFRIKEYNHNAQREESRKRMNGHRTRMHKVHSEENEREI